MLPPAAVVFMSMRFYNYNTLMQIKEQTFVFGTLTALSTIIIVLKILSHNLLYLQPIVFFMCKFDI